MLTAGLLSLAVALAVQAKPTLQVVKIHSKLLEGNPLKDSSDRTIAVFLPSVYPEDKRLPVVYYLPGFGGGPDDFVRDQAGWLTFVSQLEAKKPCVFVVVDGKNHFGCSQYIDSPASGEYAQYIAHEVVPEVEKQFKAGGSAANRVICGHSSGGFGALRLGMQFKKLFGHVVALSPDSDFELTHKPFTTNADCKKLPLARVKQFMPPTLATVAKEDGDVDYTVALCACYAADPKGEPGDFKWFYDADGNYLDSTWQMWLKNDPLYRVQHQKMPFSGSQSVYCEGPDHDDFQANIGARLIWETLSKKPIRTTFYQPPGHHGDHLPERILRGVEWSFNLPTDDVKA